MATTTTGRATRPMAHIRTENRPIARRRSSAGWIPTQHGAWAMLAVPFLVGAIRGGLHPLHLLLLGCWVVGYFAFYAAGVWMRSRRNPRYVRALTSYTIVCAALGAILVVLRPQLLGWLLIYVPIAAVSLMYSARRQDRALLNDVVTILAACIMAPVAFGIGTRASGAPPEWTRGSAATDMLVVDPAMGWVTLALVCYFVGTSLYVKTLIRERRSRGYHVGSWAYHGAVALFWLAAPFLGVPVPPLAHWLLFAFFVVMAARAGVMAGRRVRPMKVGLVEIAASTALLLILVLAW